MATTKKSTKKAVPVKATEEKKVKTAVKKTATPAGKKPAAKKAAAKAPVSKPAEKVTKPAAAKAATAKPKPATKAAAPKASAKPAAKVAKPAKAAAPAAKAPVAKAATPKTKEAKPAKKTTPRKTASRKKDTRKVEVIKTDSVAKVARAAKQKGGTTTSNRKQQETIVMPTVMKTEVSNRVKRPAPKIVEDTPKQAEEIVLVRPQVSSTKLKKKDKEKTTEKPVKMPPIKATGSIKYAPDFTSSVLDKPNEEVLISTPTMRYSDSDLAEFRELILRKLESARKELSYLQGMISRKDELGGDDTYNPYVTMEDGTMSMEREQLSQMAGRQITFIDHLEKALIRIENKTYGICRVTGKLIEKARLRAVPHATLSMEAKTSKNRVS